MPTRSDESFDLFISYAHRDNARHQVRELRDAILEGFHKFAGRDLKIFFDEDDIPSMADWEKRIARGLRESHVFLAVLSPQFFDSRYCRREVEEYVRYEAMRHCLGDGVAPVYFIELPGLGRNEVEKKIAGWAGNLRKPQLCDLRPWHDEGKRVLERAHVAERLQSLKGEIKERLSRAERTAQSPTNIYRHNPQFVGRTRELTLLREALNERGSVGVVGQKSPETGASSTATAVHGVGGMGKTELALAYAHAFGWDYPGGRWLARCEGLDNFDLVLRQLAEPLGIAFTEEEQKDAHRAGERILAELRRRDRSLLLLDNVTDPELLGPDVLMRLPPQGHVHLLATTRLGPVQLGGSPHDHTFVAVDELPTDDALALIRAHQPAARFARSEDEVAARELVKLLDGFTLAVETAAIYLGRHAAKGAIAAYSERLRRELLAESEAAAADPVVRVRHKEKLLERTLAITFETLSAEQLHILSLAALLPPDQVPLPWLQNLASETFPLLKPQTGSSDTAWQRLFNSLLSLRLFQIGTEIRIVRIHRVIQKILKQRLEEGQAASDNKALLKLVQEKAIALRSITLWENSKWEIGPLDALANIWADANHDSAAWLLSEVGLRWHDLADWPHAEQAMRRALLIDEGISSPNELNVATDLNNLGELLRATNRWVEAERLIRRALAIEQEHYGPEHPHVATSLNNLGQLLQATNRFEEAESQIRQALAITEKAHGQDGFDVARHLNNLASFLELTNRPKEAEPLRRKVATIFEKELGPHHPDLAVAINNLASLLHDTNQLPEAEEAYKRALAIDERCFGSHHPKIAIVLKNLASLLKELDRLTEAEPLMERALSINEKCYGSNHPEVANSVGGLAGLYFETNRMAEAEPLMRRALLIEETSFGAHHPTVATRLHDLAQLLLATSRAGESEVLIRRALEIDERSYGMFHPNVARDLNHLARLLQARNTLVEAEPLLRRVVNIYQTSLGEDHPDVGTSLNNLGMLLVACERWKEAEPLLRRALEIFGRTFGPGHPKVATALNNVGHLLMMTHRHDEAEPLLRRALTIDERSFGSDHPAVGRDINNIAGLLLETNRAAEAEPLMKKNLEILFRFFNSTGHHHPQVQQMIQNYVGVLSGLGWSHAKIFSQLNALGRPYNVSFGCPTS